MPTAAKPKACTEDGSISNRRRARPKRVDTNLDNLRKQGFEVKSGNAPESDGESQEKKNKTTTKKKRQPLDTGLVELKKKGYSVVRHDPSKSSSPKAVQVSKRAPIDVEDEMAKAEKRLAAHRRQVRRAKEAQSSAHAKDATENALLREKQKKSKALEREKVYAANMLCLAWREYQLEQFQDQEEKEK